MEPLFAARERECSHPHRPLAQPPTARLDSRLQVLASETVGTARWGWERRTSGSGGPPTGLAARVRTSDGRHVAVMSHIHVQLVFR